MGLTLKIIAHMWLTMVLRAMSLTNHIRMPGFNLPGTNNWVNNFACSAGADWLLMPSAVGAKQRGYIPLSYYQATGNRVALVGGRSGWMPACSPGYALLLMRPWMWARPPSNTLEGDNHINDYVEM